MRLIGACERWSRLIIEPSSRSLSLRRLTVEEAAPWVGELVHDVDPPPCAPDQSSPAGVRVCVGCSMASVSPVGDAAGDEVTLVMEGGQRKEGSEEEDEAARFHSCSSRRICVVADRPSITLEKGTAAMNRVSKLKHRRIHQPALPALLVVVRVRTACALEKEKTPYAT
jgi:hypothetical protein